MKNLFCIMMLAVCAFAFVACEEDDDDDDGRGGGIGCTEADISDCQDEMAKCFNSTSSEQACINKMCDCYDAAGCEVTLDAC